MLSVFTQEHHTHVRIPEQLVGKYIVLDVVDENDQLLYTYVAHKSAFYDYQLEALRGDDYRSERIVKEVMFMKCWTLIRTGEQQDAYRTNALFIARKTVR